MEIDTGAVVGYEALARGPEGSELERPDQLFAAAREAGRLEELDWTARIAAISGALEAGLRRPLNLFVNVEPSTLDADPPHGALDVLARARDMGVVMELTERALTERPAELFARIDRLRELGWAIALDDIGADRRSLALMPLVSPEVIKLDLRLVQDNPSPSIAGIVHAVNAETERTGAAVLAEAEPLRGEWDVVIVGPHFAAAFVAKDRGDTGPDMARRFDFCLTYDRERVIAAGRALMARVAPQGS